MSEGNFKVSHKFKLTNVSLLIVTTLTLLSLLMISINFFKSMRDSSGFDNWKDLAQKQDINKGNNLPNLVVYNNTEYGFSFKIPPFLSKEEVKNQVHYESFIRFVKTESSLGDGIYVGITKVDLGEELEIVKRLIKEQSGQVPKFEEDLLVSGLPAKIVHYSPSEDNEAKSLFFIKGNGVTVSVSSTPAQIETIKNSFNFF